MSSCYRFVLSLFVVSLIFSTIIVAQSNRNSDSPYSNVPQLGISISTTPPAVITDDATNITQTTVKLNGRVTPNGDPTTAMFQWGTSPGYGNNTSNQNLGMTGTNITVIANLSGLSPNTLYNYRIQATNGGGTTPGSNKTFKTLPLVPDVFSLSPEQITMTEATLKGEANPQGADANGWFVWGPGDSLMYTSDTTFLGNSNSFVQFFSKVELEPNTTYGYDTYAENTGGTGMATIRRFFTTLASPYENGPDGYTVGLYHFNETGSFIQDYSYNENHGETGDSPFGDPPVSIPGRYGNARSFNNTSQFIDIPTSGDFLFDDGDFTLEAWVKPELLGSTELIILSHGYAGDTTEAFTFKLTSSYEISLTLSEDGTSTYLAATNTTPIQDDVWQHVAVVVDHAFEGVKFYHNGILQASSATGVFPSAIFSTSATLRIGLPSFAPAKSSGLHFCGIDEIRISNIAREPHEFLIPGSISGIKFWDRDNNGIYEAGPDTVLGNWGIVLTQLPGNTGVSTFMEPETTFTDAFGYYSFSDVKDGKYRISEIPQQGWIQTFPRGEGRYIITIDDGSSISGNNFGNTTGYVYVGPDSGLWSDPGNWQGGIVPTDTTPVYLGNTRVVYDVAVTDTIHSLFLDEGGILIFDSSAGSLYIESRLEIEEGGTFDAGEGGVHIYCEGDFVNRGTFIGGNSRVYFSGDNEKVIIYDPPPAASLLKKPRSTSAFNGNYFYDVTVSGLNTSTNGNIIIGNELRLVESLTLRDIDTLFVENPAFDAIKDDGALPTGTVQRKLDANSSDPYRFETSDSYVEFDGTGNPEYLIVTTEPSTHPDSLYLKWIEVNATQDTTTNTFTATGVNHFSKWVFGKPGTGFRKGKARVDQDVIPKVSRQYVLTPQGGTAFNATVQLRYEDTEIDAEQDESELILGYGAFFEDTVSARWNMVSLPVEPDFAQKDSVFPTATSLAFGFDGGYVAATDLEFGTGYWLKFAGNETVSILGNDKSTSSIPVTEGWNMIGGLSYPVDPTTAILYPDGGEAENLTSTPFFGYNNGYYIADALQPLRGFWVKVGSNGTLVLSAEGGFPKQSSPSQFLQKLNSIIVEDATGGKQSLYFGYNQNGGNTFELPPSPPAGILNARFATGRLVEFLSNQQAKIIPVNISSASFPLTLSWTKLDNSGSSSLLIDGKEISMGSGGEIMISHPNAQIALRLESSPASGKPTQFALHQNYPNPFNPATMITFDLPEDGFVTLKIYNILGQEVMSAIDHSPYKAGYHTFSLITTQWSSGVYFYTLTSGSFTSTRKMILAR